MVQILEKDKKFLLWNSALLVGGYELGCSADEESAAYIRAFIEADEDLAEQDFDDPPQTTVAEDGACSSVRLCYALRLPRSFDAYLMRYPVFTVAHLANAMCEQPDVETTFGHISEMNYIQLLGLIMKLSPKRGESCITLNRSHEHTIQLSAGKPIMLFRISRPCSDSTPPQAA
jgi:hypothetical protein